MRTTEQELKVLEHRVDELIQLCNRLKEENRALRAKNSSLVSERARLIEKNDTARVRVEGILTRLKSMERPV